MQLDTSPTKSAAQLGGTLAAETYLRQRRRPGRGDVDYLILTDLLAFITEFAGQARGAVFDYGCGGSPYRGLFTGATRYIRADVTEAPGLDRLLPPDGATGEPENSYDAVLSAQVLEHVVAPDFYLSECHRILKPGGVLGLSTHGMYHEHGCPHDYYRWTSYGLEEAVRKSGLEVFRSVKFTTQARGSIQLFHTFVECARWREDHPALHAVFALLRRMHRLGGVRLLNTVGDWFSEQGLVDGHHPCNVYAGVAVMARKPAKSG